MIAFPDEFQIIKINSKRVLEYKKAALYFCRKIDYSTNSLEKLHLSN